MKVNVTVQVIQPSSGDQLSTVISYATEGGDAFTADDTVFDNNVTPNFKPEKYVVSKAKNLILRAQNFSMMMRLTVRLKLKT